jgi:very-short-patch-repair endonuclease
MNADWMVRCSARLRGHARQMRRAPTRAEDRLWSWLRGRRFSGYKFRRQYPILHYILDFYCPALKLAIEVDGLDHETGWVAEYDDERSQRLSIRGIKFLRIPNVLLIRDSLLVEECIAFAIAEIISSRR